MKTTRFITLILVAGIIWLYGCGDQPTKQSKDMHDENYIGEVTNHSYSNPDVAKVTHLDLDINVDFDSQTISGTATYLIEHSADASVIIFDIKQMDIESVRLNDDEKEADYRTGKQQGYLGAPLEVKINDKTEKVTIKYKTHPDAAALQWLSPQQTAGKDKPFLFTQSQAILARTWVPCQDAPGIRFTYTAKVKVPKGLLPVMSAVNPQRLSEDSVYTFKMDHPIPSYLMALAVGNLHFREIGNRTGVYAEPELIEEAVYEFGEMEEMLISAEKLYGPYQWGRYDVIVLPPSFPFGGMENPMLTFATPTILAGDRSLVSLVAHELAHSWSGNLVTNATWDDFWLNEGFTVYFERRIMEEVYDLDYTTMLRLRGYQDLQSELDSLGRESDDTKLKLKLEGRNPDDGLTEVAYEKGSLFLLHVEGIIGRERLDAFLKKYFNEYAFKSMTTELFIEYFQKELIGDDSELADSINLDAWIYSPGLPKDHPTHSSKRLDFVIENLKKWEKGTKAKHISTGYWTTHEWLHFLRHLPDSMSLDQMNDLDSAFLFTQSGNSEIASAWFGHALRNNYEAANDSIENFLIRVGRRKFLTPLYKAIIASNGGKERAMEIYKKARPNYHSVSTNTLDEILGWKDGE